MAPAFEESEPSPCRNCEHIYENKKTFEACINCSKRFGDDTHFRPERTRGGGYRIKTKPCEWPHGCTDNATKSNYCTEHQRLINDRKRRYKREGFTESEMEPFLTMPISKGPNRDPLMAIREFRTP